MVVSVSRILGVLGEQKAYLRERFNVSRIGCFGSYSRGEAGVGSDLDLLVEFKQPIGWEFIDLKDYLEEKTGLKVDLVSRDALKPQLRERILGEVKYA
mgnify:CR=1 FL=1